MWLFFKLQLALCFVLLVHAEVEEDKEWVLKVLNKANEESNIKKVYQTETSPANPGEATLGWENTRVKMTAETGAGQLITKSVIAVKYTASGELKAKVDATGLFTNDINMYREVVPAMEEFLSVNEDKGERLWTIAYGVNNEDKEGVDHLLEDINQEMGYKNIDKPEGLDLNHCKTAMKHLGKFHALTAVLENTGKINVDKFALSFMQRNKADISSYYDKSLNDFANSIDVAWGPGWEEVSAKIRGLTPGVLETMLNSYDEKSAFNVINYGSFYIGDLNFKYGASDVETFESPIAMKFGGFHMVFRNTPAFDLQQFMYTSPKPELLSANRDVLLKTYHDSLLKYLKKYDYRGEPPTYEYILSEVARTEVYGLVNSITDRMYYYIKPEDMPDLEKKVMDKWEGKEVTIDNKEMLLPEYIKDMKIIVQDIIKDRNAI